MRSLLQLLDAGLAGVDIWSDKISRALFRVAVQAALPALMALVTLDVVLRYVFNSPLPWGRDVNGLLLLVTVFSALPHGWDRGYHIRMEVFYNRFGDRARGVADVASAAAGILFFALMGVQALRFTPYMEATGETGEDLLLPVWPFMLYMGLCALVLVARLLGNPNGGEAEAYASTGDASGAGTGISPDTDKGADTATGIGDDTGRDPGTGVDPDGGAQ